MNRALTAEGYRTAERALARRDPVLRALIKAHGPCLLARAQREDPFVALVEAIVWQQLSGKAASTIYGRVRNLLPEGAVTPGALLAAGPDALRAAGLSRAKVLFLRDLAQKVADGAVRLDCLGELDDEGVIEELTRIKGIGRWSAEMFLMFRLHRPDVFPAGDVGVVNAMKQAYRLRKTPTPARMRQIAEPWRPYRSVGTWYLWRSLSTVAPGENRPA